MPRKAVAAAKKERSPSEKSVSSVDSISSLPAIKEARIEDGTVAAAQVPPRSLSPPGSSAAMPAAAEEVVPLAALVAVNVDRNEEASFGLLKEPGPPSADVRRVTKEGEGAPAIPTDLLQLLSG
ncbi:conserved hypothetical protein [Leishmania mexicana MHOM/GT/2001/U1103]|uniref:Uncharacterized protein n=1 Tax=Leishmania mexicana (strain MHOM/GT/2001/U1103) TaxID=929439 RepID=E9AST0_LEIMU|nr:conserved hypothetical protein [Leishmania mexicana MHOM/GT/2001/U1103]CBZ26004.1 conserved hypothetical protein [Leishmania mexicana MHOM/GT/2001/U1103]